LTKCEFCNKDLDIDTYAEKIFCNWDCLNEYKRDFFNYNIDEYIDEHIHEIVKENLDIARDYLHE
jgi:hypothetical protein